MSEKRLLVGCRDCAWAASSTDHAKLGKLIDSHINRYPEHTVFERNWKPLST
jgi:hypothetical protein